MGHYYIKYYVVPVAENEFEIEFRSYYEEEYRPFPWIGVKKRKRITFQSSDILTTGLYDHMKFKTAEEAEKYIERIISERKKYLDKIAASKEFKKNNPPYEYP